MSRATTPRDLTRRRGHTTQYATHRLGPGAGQERAVRQDPDPATVPASAGPYPWRAGWRAHDPNRPCWTCGSSPTGTWPNGSPKYDWGSHRWDHAGIAPGPLGEGEWVDEDWRPPRRDY